MEILKALVVAALFALFHGGGTFPSFRHARAADHPCNVNISIPECQVQHDALNLLGAGTTTSEPFNVTISIMQSINDAAVFLSAGNGSTSSIEKIQDLEEVSTDDGDTCSYYYLLKPPAARDLLHPYCSWYYNCNYDARRIPQHLCRAQCSETCLHCPQGYSCKPVLYKVPVLTLNSDFHQCHPYLETVLDPAVQWTWSQEIVPVSCACQKTATSDCQGV